ncbi:MAG: YajQ family cyclic di-GMP-binding protein [Clostridia bacterium]|jgi:uncharacterized protein YajQ (UPF0234 family)|nr:YajQ family cyclic di-GMP-binding protein [Clostridia bacterium]
MAKDPSFDVVSKVDMQELDNAVNQTKKEITQRFDFRGSKSEVNIDGDDVKILTEDDFRLKSIIDVLQTKLIKRGISIKNLDYGKIEDASGGMVRQSIKIKQGIDTDLAKNIIKDIKGTKIKVQAQIMDDQIRISGKNRDDLQAVIAFIREQDYDIDLQFTNYR